MEFPLWLILLYLAVVNFTGMLVTILDKRRAKRDAWRISERTLFFICALGGCPGVYFTMRAVRHKTRHKRFMLGIPAIFILQTAIIIALYYYMHRGIKLL